MTATAPFVLTVVTLGVSDKRHSVRFYEDLGLARKFKETGDTVAFFDAGGLVLALYGWDLLAEDASMTDLPRPQAFRGMTLARNCRTDEEVDATMEHALSIGATLLRRAGKTSYGWVPGLFRRP